MGITSIFKGELANSIREKKQFLEWMRGSDISIKKLKNCVQTIDSLRELAKVSDIHALKPASGWKRKLQLDSIHLAGDVIEELEGVGIEAFLYAGCLIGYARHGGFIPWDDDVDFCIMRPHFNRLIEYFEQNYSVLYTSGRTYEDDMGEVDEFCRKHLGEPVLIKFFNYAKYTIADNHVKRVTIDFFPYDYIKEGTDFKEYRQYVYDFLEQSKQVPRNEKNAFCTEAEKNNPYSSLTPTSIIGSGLDCVPRNWLYERAERFIPSGYVIPLKKVDFEGRMFKVPADHEKFLEEFKCPGFDTYPRQFSNGGLAGHEEGYSGWFVRHGTKAELTAHSEEEVRALLPLYGKLRDNNIFAEFIDRIPGDDWGYIMDSYEVRYVFRRNFDSQWAVSMRGQEDLKGYKNNKLVFTGDTEGAIRRITEGSGS